MKKIAEEFKKFISRGNVIDMSVGVIVGSAFTGIVNGLSNFILKPIINWLLTLVLGKDSLLDIHTLLVPVYGEDGVIDTAQSIYIDWGAFINAIINFFLVAIVLFAIVKIINGFKESNEKWIRMLEKGKLTKEDKKILKSRGIKLSDKAAVSAYIEEKRIAAEKLLAEKKAEEEEKARLEREANPTVEDLLKKILEKMDDGAKLS
ncbi:MAG: large conductance mechanosensitive channel protein MscL [Clostridia bacterium]|nr:large conductance mechanosensitive channel protein MscL [Clostridia bacterium]